jgi:hypothetical protein
MNVTIKFISYLILYKTYKTFRNPLLKIFNPQINDSCSCDLILIYRLLICILYTCLV